MKYSIITPVYNREDCISRCIESVLKQVNLLGGVEHIIVNDGSTDLTDTICRGYAKSNSSIKYFSFDTNKGTNAARNAAIKIAAGDYCIILDSDDYFVDDAILTINQTVISNPEYKHFMFAPNDVDYDKSILAGCNEKELTYVDFLSGKITTGFIHCISTDIMKRHPFDDSVRIYEGVFFLSFYKETQKMLFTDKVVTIRERGRSDSVTLDFVRTKRELIERGIKANEIMLSLFGEDLKHYHCRKTLIHLYVDLLDSYLLLGKYTDIIQLDIMYNEKYKDCIPHNTKVKMLKLLKAIKGGNFYWMGLKSFFFLKYYVLKYRIK